MNKDAFLRTLGFPEWVSDPTEAAVDAAYPPEARRGIYVLEFQDGQHYVGETGNVSKRLSQHLNSWDDVAKITFQPFADGNLKRLEQWYVHQLRDNGFVLRNTPTEREITVSFDFNALISPDQQAAWMDGQLSVPDDTPRAPHPLLLVPDEHKLKRFEALPHATEARMLLGTYLQVAVPLPRRTELLAWTVTCRPKGEAGHVAYCRVNMGG